MPLDGSGNFIPLAGAGNAAPLTKIMSKSQHNDLWADAALAISAKIDASGVKSFTAPVRGVAGTLPSHLVTKLQLDAAIASVPDSWQFTPEAYGALGDGTGDDRVAIIAAASANGGYVEGMPGSVYRLGGQMTIPAVFRFNLRGATLLPSYQGTSYALYRQEGSGAANDVESHIAGSRSITVADAVTDIASGDWVIFSTTSYSGRWPAFHRRVTSVTGGGTVINMHAAIPWALPENTTVRKWIGGGDLEISNGVIDCSQITDAGGDVLGLMFVDGHENVRLRSLEIENYALSAGSTDYVFAISRARNVSTDELTIEQGTGERGVISTFNCGNAIHRNIYYDGDGFGIADVNAEVARTENLTARGRWVFGGSSASIRAWRPIGCGTAELVGADIIGFDSGVKNEDNITFHAERLKIRNCNVGINISHQNPGPQLGDVTIRDAIIEDPWAYGIYDIERLCENHSYTGITIRRPRDHGINMGGKKRFLSGVRVFDWLSAKHPIVLSTISGVVPTGSIRDVTCETVTTLGRLAISVPAAATGFMIDDRSIVCNIAGASGGGYENRPPRVFDVPPGGIELGRATVNMNSTADQAVTLALPSGYTRYRLLAVIVTNAGSANHSAAVGGFYANAGKADAIVAATQTYTAMTGLNTNQQLTITASGVQQMQDLTCFFSLSTASGVAGNAIVQVFGYPVP